MPKTERMTIRTSEPELVARLLRPECRANWPSVFDHDACFRPSVNGQNAHRNLVHARDPDHGELAWLGVVESRIGEPERTYRRGFVNDMIEPHCPGRVKLLGCLLQA